MRTDELQEIKQCPYCHVEVTVDDFQCPKCGATLIWSQYVERISPKPHRDNLSEHQTDDHLEEK